MSRGLGCLPAPKCIYIPYHIEWLYIQSWQKNRKNQKKIEKIKKIEKNKKCSEQFLGPLPGP